MHSVASTGATQFQNYTEQSSNPDSTASKKTFDKVLHLCVLFPKIELIMAIVRQLIVKTK